MSKNQAKTELPSLSLLLQAKDGNQAAFEKLLMAYAPLIDSMTSRFSTDEASKMDLEDLRQEAVLAFYRAIKTFDVTQTKVSFGLYAKECIRNALISCLRKLKRHEHVVLLEDEDSLAAENVLRDDPAARLLEQESYTELMRLIQSALSPFENTVWRLVISGRTAKEIASLLQTNERSIANAVYRIRKKLRTVIPSQYTPT